MAMLRLESGAALPQYSLLAPPGVRRASQRLLDGELGLRIQRRQFLSRAASRRARIPVIRAAGENDYTKTGTKKLFKLPGTLKIRKKDTNVVFVAGATGNVGSRTVKELIKSGLRVRAGVRSVDKAETILGETIASITASSPLDKVLAFFGLRRDDQLEIIDCDLEKPEDIDFALGNAGVVICAIGASEKEVLDVTGPYRIDYEATKNLISAAKNAEVKHFILVTSLGTTKFGLPASVLNLFWGVLIWKAKAEKALTDSGLTYTIVRPGGMERPTDAFKETHNLRLAPKDTFTGGQVSRLQVAELLACIANNLELAEDKILEAIAETSAPLRSLEDLLIEIPSQSEKGEPGRKISALQAGKKGDKDASTKAEEKRKSEEIKQKEAQNEAKRKASEAKKAQDEAKRAQDEAKRKAIEAKKAQELRKKISEELSALKEQEMAADAEAKSLQRKRMELSEKAQEAQEAAAKAEAVAKALLTAAKEGKRLSEADKRKILEAESTKVLQPPKISTKTSVPEPPKASKKVAATKVSPAKSKVLEPSKKKEVAPNAKNVEKIPGKNSTETTQAVAPADQPQAKNPEKLESEQPPTKLPENLYAEEPTKSEELQSKVVKSGSPTEEDVKKVESTKPEPVNETQAKALPIEEKDTTESEPAREPFRWFWQQTETAKSSEAEAEAKAPLTEEEAPPREATRSPYPGYPDLKPPASPTPESPSENEAPSEAPSQVTAEMTTREREEAALLKAKSNLSFRWPWKNENTAETPISDVQGESEVPAAASSSQSLSSVIQEKAAEKVDDAAEKADDTAAKDQSSVIQEEPSETSITPDADSPPLSSVISKEAETEAATIPPPETATADIPPPEAAFADPPPPETAPTEKETVLEGNGEPELEAAQFDPQKVKERERDSLAKAKAASTFVWPWNVTSTEQKAEKDEPEKKVVEAIQVDTPPAVSSPLSPYPSYPDWKPPTSPTPQPPEPVKSPEKAAEEPVQALDKIEEKKAEDKEQPDFSAATVKEREEAALAKARAALSWQWKVETEEQINSESALELSPVPASRPLSPYTRYEDLKPPASPTPRPPAKEVPKAHRTPQTSSARVGDALASDVVDEAAEEAKSRAVEALEKAKASAGMKWPWV